MLQAWVWIHARPLSGKFRKSLPELQFLFPWNRVFLGWSGVTYAKPRHHGWHRGTALLLVVLINCVALRCCWPGWKLPLKLAPRELGDKWLCGSHVLPLSGTTPGWDHPSWRYPTKLGKRGPPQKCWMRTVDSIVGITHSGPCREEIEGPEKPSDPEPPQELGLGSEYCISTQSQISLAITIENAKKKSSVMRLGVHFPWCCGYSDTSHSSRDHQSRGRQWEVPQKIPVTGHTERSIPWWVFLSRARLKVSGSFSKFLLLTRRLHTLF